MYRIRAIYLSRPDMHFDRDYYQKQHLSLAHRQLGDNIVPVRMDVEWDVRGLMGDAAVESPCTLSIYLESWSDVEKFRQFMQSPAVQPLIDDVPRYTNCSLAWTVAQVDEVT